MCLFRSPGRGDREIGVAINRDNRTMCLIDSAITLVNAVLRHYPSGHGTEPTGCVESTQLPSIWAPVEDQSSDDVPVGSATDGTLRSFGAVMTGKGKQKYSERKLL